MVPNTLDKMRDEALAPRYDTDKERLEGWITLQFGFKNPPVYIRLLFKPDGTVGWDRHTDLRNSHWIKVSAPADRNVDDVPDV